MKRGNGFLSLFLSLALLALAGTSTVGAQDQPTSAPPSPQPNLLNSDGTVNWQALDQASQQIYEQAKTQAQMDSDLSSSLGDLQKQYTELLSSIKVADQAKDKVVSSALFESNLWRDGAIVVGAAFGGYLYNKWPGSAKYALAGLAFDACLEIFKIRF